MNNTPSSFSQTVRSLGFVTFAALLIACQDQTSAQEAKDSPAIVSETAESIQAAGEEIAEAANSDKIDEKVSAETSAQSVEAFTGNLDESKYKAVATQMKPSTGDKIEVAELFWFGCGHCFALEPALKRWKADIPANAEFVKVPAIFSKRWEFHAKAFYAMEALNAPDEAYEQFFRSIHVDRRQINTFSHLVEFMAKFEKTESEVESAFNSFQVDSKLRSARKITRDSGATGVPAMIVDGKYITSQQQAGGQEQMFITVNELIKKTADER